MPSGRIKQPVAPPHVRRRRRERRQRLRELGYADYADYLKSSHWERLRAAYWQADDTPKTCFCGETDGLQLHHRTYTRLGAEEFSDLLPMCAPCHVAAHVLERRGDLGLDLAGFQSRRRAARNRLGVAEARAGRHADQADAWRTLLDLAKQLPLDEQLGMLLDFANARSVNLERRAHAIERLMDSAWRYVENELARREGRTPSVRRAHVSDEASDEQLASLPRTYDP